MKAEAKNNFTYQKKQLIFKYILWLIFNEMHKFVE